MINNKKPLHQIISEKFLCIFYNRINPFTRINFVTDNYSKTEFGFYKLSAFQALKELKRQVNEAIAATGVTTYIGDSIWDLSAYKMKTALSLIKHGIAKHNDFSYSPISKIHNPKFAQFESDKDEISRKLDGERLEFDNIARGAAKTQKEFSTLSFNFMYYKNHVYRIANYTKKITAAIAEFGTNKYNGKDLYEITELDLLYEAFGAFSIIRRLKKDFFITHYNGTPLEELTKFTLEKIDDQMDNENFDGCAINKPDKIETIPEVKPDPAIVSDRLEQEKKELAKTIKRIVQAELKKYQEKMSITKTAPVKTKRKSKVAVQDKEKKAANKRTILPR